MSWAAIAVALTVAGCGGGGGGGDGSATTATNATIQGVVATGSPMANAAVTLTDTSGATLTATADASGAYSFSLDPSKFVAPYALVAVDPSGAAENQVSIALTTPALGATTTVNITPLTTAIVAGSIDSGNPADLSSPSVLRAVKAADVQAAQAAIRQSLQTLLTDAGVSNSADLIASPMVANHTGMDKVLDEVNVEPVGGGMQITNSMNLAGSNQTVVVSKSGLSAVQNTVFRKDVDGAVIATGNFAAIKNGLQQCLNQAPGIRVANGVLSAACQSSVATDFLNSGKAFAATYASLLADASFTNAVVQDPKVVFVVSPTKVLLEVPITKTNGYYTANAYAELVGGTWLWRGNQLPYDVNVSAYLDELLSVSGTQDWTAPVHKYRSGLFLYASSAIPSIQYAIVKGPGLPSSGVTLAPPSTAGKTYLGIINNTGAPTSGTTANGNGFCLDSVTIASDGSMSPTVWDSSSTSSPTRVSDLSALNGYPEYEFILHFKDGSEQTYKSRLTIAPKAPATGAGLRGRD